ncbi:MAG: adenylosuccinate lyase, partial [Alphaproteobacteria bacterium CG11_big_fil_rev_8_21_14_0_20_44_7]
MIPRYSREKMADIWTAENKYQIWFDIEAHATDALAELGVVPESAAKAIWAGRPEKIDVARIDEIEATTKHDVIAFLTYISENVGEEARFLHQGMTSSDVLDTCLAVQLKQSADILIEDVEKLLSALKKRAQESKDMICIGRSHGIHAEPTTMGLKFARFYAEIERSLKRLK